MKSKAKSFFSALILMFAALILPATSVHADVCPLTYCPDGGTCCPTDPTPVKTTSFDMSTIGTDFPVGTTFTRSQMTSAGIPVTNIDKIASTGSAYNDSDFQVAADGTTFDGTHTENPLPGSMDLNGTIPDTEPTEYDPNAQLGDPKYRVVATWKDRFNRTIYLRAGYNTVVDYRGFGLAHMWGKHNVTTAVARTVTKTDTRPDYVSGEKWNFDAKAQRWLCSGWGFWSSCKLTGNINVRVAHDFRHAKPYPGSFGIVTAYCTGYVRCPDWVQRTANFR